MFDTFMMGAPGGIFCAFAITDYELSSIKKPREIRQNLRGAVTKNPLNSRKGDNLILHHLVAFSSILLLGGLLHGLE